MDEKKIDADERGAGANGLGEDKEEGNTSSPNRAPTRLKKTVSFSMAPDGTLLFCLSLSLSTSIYLQSR